MNVLYECDGMNVENVIYNIKNKQKRVATHATKPLNVKGTGSLIDSAFGGMNVLIYVKIMGAAGFIFSWCSSFV
jgi:hypothetical protein